MPPPISPRADVFFAGDLLYTEFHPVTVYRRIKGWIETLGGLSEVNFGKIMPAHDNAHPVLSITQVIPSM
jgi:glyoxylase-like metal-dependent hydrolase (beta-lactamase superfamily II)